MLVHLFADPMFKTINKKIFAILLLAGLSGVIAGMPYMADMADMLAVAAGTAPIAKSAVPLPWLVAVVPCRTGSCLRSLFSWGCACPARWDCECRFSVPDGRQGDTVAGGLAGRTAGRGNPGSRVSCGRCTVFLPHLPAPMQSLFRVPLWKRLLAGVLYGGLTEELLMRLFLLPLAVWFAGRWWKQADGMPAPGAFRAAIGLVALLFALAHLPATAAVVPLTPMLVLRALVLNGLAGVVFGFLAARRGRRHAGPYGSAWVLRFPAPAAESHALSRACHSPGSPMGTPIAPQPGDRLIGGRGPAPVLPWPGDLGAAQALNACPARRRRRSRVPFA